MVEANPSPCSQVPSQAHILMDLALINALSGRANTVSIGFTLEGCLSLSLQRAARVPGMFLSQDPSLTVPSCQVGSVLQAGVWCSALLSVLLRTSLPWAGGTLELFLGEVKLSASVPLSSSAGSSSFQTVSLPSCFSRPLFLSGVEHSVVAQGCSGIPGEWRFLLLPCTGEDLQC